MLIAGEPGIGKTTLLDWSAEVASGTTALRAAGRESEADLPFVAVADLLRPLQDRISELPGTQAKALDSALALAGPSPADRGAVNAAALNLLAKSCQDAPLLVLIDDYHWLDSASRDVIDFIARRTETAGFGMVLTTRGRLPADHRGSQLQLQPLLPEVAAAVVAGRGQASPEAVRRIVALAAGNPLALVELPLHLGSSDHDPPFGEPVSVSGAVERAYRTRPATLCFVRWYINSLRRVMCVAAIWPPPKLSMTKTKGPGTKRRPPPGPTTRSPALWKTRPNGR